MPCATDLTHVSTNSLPSTLLKKTNGRNQVPFHDRIVASAVTKLQQRNDTDDDRNVYDDELSSVSTQSTPASRSQPSQSASKNGSTTTSSKSNREVALDENRNRPLAPPYQLQSTINSNSQRPRRPSPERTMSYPNTAIATKTNPRTHINAPSSKSRTMKDRVTTGSHVYKEDIDEFLSRTNKSSSPIDFTDSILHHPSIKSLSSSARDGKKTSINQTNTSNHNSTIQPSATDMSEVLGRTIPYSGSSVNVLCSNDEDDDDRHRCIVTITTSRSTIKASGGRNRYPSMDDYVAPTSPLRAMKSYSFSNYSTQLEEDEDEDAEDDDVCAKERIDKFDSTKQNERKDILHESNHSYDHTVSNADKFSSAKFQNEREKDIISAASSRRSGKLSTIVSEPSRDNTSGCVPNESRGRNENYTTSSIAMSIGKDEESQSKTLSSTRFIRNANHNDDDDIVEAQRENEILSAASRKSGKTGQTGVRTHASSSNRSREVMIEDHEKPQKAEPVQSTTAWRKIDDVLFGDDHSELHLFKSPAKDVAFDDLLTTTSDCSSISVSLDPSGCVVNDSNISSSKRLDQVRNVITDVEFNRVKSVLDQMKKPMAVHTSTNNTGIVTSRAGPTAAVNAPKMKNRIGTGNFVQNRFKNTPQVSIVRAAKQLEETRKASVVRPKLSEPRVVKANYFPIVVQARSFHGDATKQNIIESEPVLKPALPNQSVLKMAEHRRNSPSLPFCTTTGSSGRKDPPANTLCSEKR